MKTGLIVCLLCEALAPACDGVMCLLCRSDCVLVACEQRERALDSIEPRAWAKLKQKVAKRRRWYDSEPSTAPDMQVTQAELNTVFAQPTAKPDYINGVKT